MENEKLKKFIMPMRIILLIILSILVFLIFNLYTTADGFYSKELNAAVVLTKDNSWERQMDVAAHEVGHYIYFKKLTQKQRDEYERIFKDSNSFVSEYSKINAAENFAEEYAYSMVAYRCNSFVSEDKKEFFNYVLDNNC